MEETVELKKIASSSTLLVVAQILALGFQFITGVLVIRIISPEQFGLLSLGLTVIGVLVVFINFGMPLGLPRTISKQMVVPESNSIVGQTIISSVLFTLSFALLFALFLYSGADKLTQFFEKEGLADVIKLLSLTVLPLASITILGGISQGLELTRPVVFFQKVCLNFIKLFFVICVVATGAGFTGILVANILTAGVTFLLFAIYIFVKLKNRFKYSFALYNAKQLLHFSFPLLGVQLLNQMIVWATTLLLSYYHSAAVVGLYSAPLRLVVILSMPLQAVSYLYLPIATRSIASKEAFDLSGLYTKITKWLAVFTLPMALAMIFDSKFIVAKLFAERYLASSSILAVLAIGFSFHALVGPNGMTLIAFGKRRAMFNSTALGGGVSILVSLILIPKFGSLGSAIAVCVGLVFSKVYLCCALYKVSKIHSFRMEVFKPVIFIVFVSVSSLLIVNIFDNTSILIHTAIYIAMVFISLFAPFITLSLSFDERRLIFEFLSKLRGLCWVKRA